MKTHDTRFRVEYFALAGAIVWSAIGDSPPASAICRVVEPALEVGVPFDTRTAAVFVLAPDQVVDYACIPGGDGGTVPTTDEDAGVDAGAPQSDAGDASVPSDGGIEEVEPLCPPGMIADPIRGSLVSIVVQPSVLASGGSAGLVMPVPARPDVFTASSTLIGSALPLMTPLVHETVTVHEDQSLGFQCSDPHYSSDATDVLVGAPLMLYGCGGDGSSDYYRPGTETREPEVTVYDDAGVVRYETFPSTDAYDVTVLNASSSEALNLWLDEHGFAHDEHDDAAFAAYVGDDAWFVAVHVHPPDMGGEQLALEPLVVTWRGDTIPITHRLQYDPNGGMIVTDAFVIAPTRMDAADGSAFTEHAAPARFAGTELDSFGVDAGWLTRLSFTRFAAQEREDSTLVPSREGEVRATVERTVEVRIPAPCCPGGSVAPSSTHHRTFTHERTYTGSFAANPIPEAWYFPDEPFDDATACADPYGSGGSCGGGSSSSGRTLRGCSSARPTRWGAILSGWGPIALIVLLVVWRNRPRR